MKSLCRCTLVVSFLVHAVGCCSQKLGEVDAFKWKHPREAVAYISICPIDYESMERLLASQHTRTTTYFTKLREKFGNDAGVVMFADRVIKSENDIYDKSCGYFSAMEREASSVGGVAALFSQQTDQGVERGVVILKNGDIVRRDVYEISSDTTITRSFIPGKSGTRHPPSVRNEAKEPTGTGL